MAPRGPSTPPRTFEAVFAAELSLIEKRRLAGGFTPERHPLDAHHAIQHGLVGLALSGGGIRSASVNLGVLQALGKRGVLHHVDYLSTVSGGGYIGAALSSLAASPWASMEPGPAFPFWFDGRNENPVIKYLRQNRQYLGVEGGLLRWRTWRAISAYVGGLLVTVSLVVAFLAFGAAAYLGVLPWPLYFGARLSGHDPARSLTFATDIYKYPGDYVSFLMLPALALLGLWAATGVVYAAANIRPSLWRLSVRDWLARRQSFLLAGAALLAAIGFLPLALEFFDEVFDRLRAWLASAALLSSLSLPAIARASQNLKAAETALRAAKRRLVATGATVLVLLICFGALYGVWVWRGQLLWIALGALAVMFVLTVFTDINRISMFYFYRDRLSEAFVIRREAGTAPTDRGGAVAGPRPLSEVRTNDAIPMADLAYADRRVPYHLVNTCVNLPGSDKPELKDRRCDFFLLSPLYCGSPVLGYRDTREYEGNRVTLASALAVSGAAANPQFGTESRPALAFLLTMLNARLGVWAQNPGLEPPARRPEFAYHVEWPVYLVREMLSLAKETDRLVNLSDGGHIDNLGLYELLRRRCRTIIVSDASADPLLRFDDLGNALRKARIDFGIEVELDLASIAERKAHAVTGRIRYPSGEGRSDDGVLVYIKSVLIAADPMDLHQYQKVCPSFPHEPTTDQSFDEPQFESYRQLGYEAGKAMCQLAAAQGVGGLGLEGQIRELALLRRQRLTQ